MLAPLLAFLDRDTLLGVGVSLVVAGVVLRGFTRSLRRSSALRREHNLHVRKLGPASSATPLGRYPAHFERHLGRYAAASLVLGLVLVIAGFTHN